MGKTFSWRHLGSMTQKALALSLARGQQPALCCGCFSARINRSEMGRVARCGWFLH
jgi:hypothetical protein